MKKYSILAQWLVVAALVASVGYVLVRPTPQPDYAPETWRNWSGVTVLSYAGIARRDTPAYPSVKRLEAQLCALRDAGYKTVRPEDVRAYLDGRAPLPEKALLLIFEGGRKEAFIRATPVLQRTGFKAVIAVPTTVMSQWGSFYLKRSDLRRIVKLPQWQVGSMGHQATEPILFGDPAQPGRFLAQRTRPNGQAESADAFRARILQDYASSAHALEEATGKPPLLYLYAFAEAGQSPGSDPLAEAANRDAVTRHFGLAFIGGANAFNGPSSDPWSLTRLRVPGDWAPERLLAELASSQPRSRTQSTLGTAQDWVFERNAELLDNAMRLGDGSVAWLRGSDTWTDVEASATLRPDAACIASLYARSASARSWVRVTVDAEGLRVQERLGDRLFTLFRHPASGVARDEQQLRLRIRNNRAWVWLDGRPIASNLPLSPDSSRGRLGFGSQQGRLTVSAFSARPLPARWVLANSLRLVPDDAREQVQSILPTWFRAGELPNLPQTAQQELLQSAVAGIRTQPLATGAAELDAEAARAWAAAIDAELIRTDLKLLTPVLAVEGPAFALSAELRNRNYRITHLLSPAQALASGCSIAQVSPSEDLVVNATGAEADRAIDWLLRTIPASRLALRETDGAAFAPDLATVRRLDPNGGL